MQRHALEVQLAAAEEYEPVEVAVDLRAITAPSLVVAGAKDVPDFRLIAAELAGLLPAARLVELPWAGHLPTLERPQELSAMLVAFLPETLRPAVSSGRPTGRSQSRWPESVPLAGGSPGWPARGLALISGVLIRLRIEFCL
jgi:hypothetical protein